MSWDQQGGGLRKAVCRNIYFARAPASAFELRFGAMNGALGSSSESLEGGPARREPRGGSHPSLALRHTTGIARGRA